MSSLKKLSFKSIIPSIEQKLAEKSRSKSRTRSKASSISKSNSTQFKTENVFPHTKTTSETQKRKEEPKVIEKAKEEKKIKHERQSIFRSSSNNKNVQQQQMKKIIRLKNQTTQLQIKIQGIAQQSLQNEMPNDKENKDNNQNASKLEEITNFLEEFDLQNRKKVKQIGENYLNKLSTVENQLAGQNHIVPKFTPLIYPMPSLQMSNLQKKLKQIQNRWLK